ncbi:MAG: serine--tRNA ligase [Desulfobacterota bacterium]|nr:serine--tRNA ligase [Thermodesulfobacteriota bacterium]
MLDIKFIRENAEHVQRKLMSRGTSTGLAELVQLDERRRETLHRIETLRAERNRASDEIASFKKQKKEVPPERFQILKEVSQQIKQLEETLKTIEQETTEVLLTIPNLPHDSVPVGRGAEDNPVVRTWGTPTVFSFQPRPHWEIGERLGILDFERAAKIAGARFSLYRGAGALLERALINFMLDLHTREHGYCEILPPLMVNRQTMTGTGQLPKFADDLFKIQGFDYFLIPTAEVPVTNIHQQEILDEQALPIQYVSYTPCFRSEAGSYGKDTRGLIRQHQFNKVELVKFSKPETSYEELEKLLADAEEVLRRLGIHYRVTCLCTGDLGFAAAKTYDIEVWLPSQAVYREISSCSNFEDFQARRAGIRYRKKDAKKTEFVHTLNGSGLAVGRTFVAVLENYQQQDGSVLIPDVLRPYMNGMERIEPPR